MYKVKRTPPVSYGFKPWQVAVIVLAVFAMALDVGVL
jgi:hypothetical protein